MSAAASAAMSATWVRSGARIPLESNAFVPVPSLEPRHSAARPPQAWLYGLVRSSKDNVLEFEQAQLTLPARRRALQVRSIAQAARDTRDLEEDIIALHEGGVSVSFGNEKIHREVVFVVPRDGAVLYFIARGTDRFRRAGIVLRDTAIATLARWASRESVEFSSRDLEVG